MGPSISPRSVEAVRPGRQLRRRATLRGSGPPPLALASRGAPEQNKNYLLPRRDGVPLGCRLGTAQQVLRGMATLGSVRNDRAIRDRMRKDPDSEARSLGCFEAQCADLTDSACHVRSGRGVSRGGAANPRGAAKKAEPQPTSGRHSPTRTKDNEHRSQRPSHAGPCAPMQRRIWPARRGVVHELAYRQELPSNGMSSQRRQLHRREVAC